MSNIVADRPLIAARRPCCRIPHVRVERIILKYHRDIARRRSTDVYRAVQHDSPVTVFQASTMRSSVDLPQPEAPTITNISRSRAARSICRKTSVSPIFSHASHFEHAIYFSPPSVRRQTTLHQDDNDHGGNKPAPPCHHGAPVGFRLNRDHFHYADHDVSSFDCRDKHGQRY